jgi:penicillin-binding protein 1A
VVEAHLAAAQWYFPYYKLDPKRSEIGLREYDLAAKALEADQRSLTAAAGIVLFFSGAATTFVGSGTGVQAFISIAHNLGSGLEIGLAASVATVAFLSTHYFARLQRSGTYAARKIVVLRRLLGLDYGNIESVLPADSLDGANEPFSIEMFPGWTSIQALPVVVVALVTGCAIFGIVSAFSYINPGSGSAQISDWLTLQPFEAGILWGALGAVLLCVFYRWSLLDDFETPRLREAMMLGRFLGTPLKARVGHVLYRLRLSVYEAERLGLRLPDMFKMLVSIEDRAYYRHNGNSLNALAKALIRYARYRKLAGASTIYQQLARSNLLTVFDAPLRRKLLEWMLAPWLNGQFTKEEGLKAYLCSVRYARGVIGLPAALDYFFPSKPLTDPISPAEQFVLIERLSNVSQTYPAPRVESLIASAKRANLLSDDDVKSVHSHYDRLKRAGKIKGR